MKEATDSLPRAPKEIKCQHCGNALTFRWQKKFCSYKCGSEARATHNKACCDCGSQKKQRRSVRCKPCSSKKHSQRQQSLEINPRLFSNEEIEKKRLSNVLKNLEQRRISGDLAKPKKADCHRRFSQKHVKAVECFFRDPRNVVHYCKNISAFVWNNKFLFQPEDVEKKIHAGKERPSYTCNATQGLAQVQRGYCGTWKGWMLVGEREGRERFDLIGRNFQT